MSAEEDLQNFRAVLVDQEEDEPKELVVNKGTIALGFERILALHPTATHTAEQVWRAVLAGDSGDIDAGLADSIVQMGLFNEIVYG